MKIIFLILTGLFLLGCGSKETIAIHTPLDTKDNEPPSHILARERPDQKRSHVVSPIAANRAPSNRGKSPPANSSKGIISREDLNVILAAGPAAILAAVVTEPVRKNGRFIGFKITRFTDRAPQTIDLRAGDIILKANGRTIERPENYFAFFEDLKIATQLRLDVLRNGELKTLIYPIQKLSNGDMSLPSTEN